MINFPNVGIIISNYNYGEYVYDAIKSALHQKYQGEIRVYVVDDGSSDDSWKKICDITCEKETTNLEESYYNGPLEFRQKDNLYAYRINNSGASTARNVGIYQSLGWAHVFGILDADDEYYKDKVEILTKKLTEHPEVGVAYADYDIHRTFNNLNYTKYEHKQPYNKLKLLNECIVHSGALIQKEYLNAVKLPTGEFYDSNLHGPLSKGFIGCTEDYDLWLRLAEVCVMVHVAKSLSLVRETGNNQSMRMNPEIFSQNVNFIQNRNKNA